MLVFHKITLPAVIIDVEQINKLKSIKTSKIMPTKLPLGFKGEERVTEMQQLK